MNCPCEIEARLEELEIAPVFRGAYRHLIRRGYLMVIIPAEPAGRVQLISFKAPPRQRWPRRCR